MISEPAAETWAHEREELVLGVRHCFYRVELQRRMRDPCPSPFGRKNRGMIMLPPMRARRCYSRPLSFAAASGTQCFQTTQRYAHLQPDAHKAVLGAWERLEAPLVIAA